MEQERKNQLNAMKYQLFGRSQIKTMGRITKGSAGGRLPAVESFEVVTNYFNKLIFELGISLRMPTKFKSRDTTMERCNKYMKHQLRRINKYKYTKPELAGRIAIYSIKYSLSFRMSAINHVIPDGYFKYNISEIGKICRKVNKLLKTSSPDLDYKRVYIPKPNGKYRPLGVPTIEGRIVLHMGNNMFIEFFRMEISKDSHAYIPGRGTKTAWQSIIRKINKSKYVYETDLKSFFDKISVFEIRKVLKKSSIPDGLLLWIERLFECKPKLPEIKHLDETRFNIDYEIDPDGQVIYYPSLHVKGDKIILTKNGFFNYKGDKQMGQKQVKMFERKAHQLVYKYMMEPKLGVKPRIVVVNKNVTPGGVPQGMPLSPLLSILPLRELYLSQQDHVNYADDQVFFGDKEFEIKDCPEKGIIHNKEKCAGVKGDGKGTPEGIKFLGYRMTEQQTFSSETRSGTKEYVKKEIREIYTEKTLRELEKITDTTEFGEILSKYHKEFSGNEERGLENMAKRNIFGFVLSCLNNADGENQNSRRYAEKGFRNLLGKVNKKSYGGKMPTNTSSSAALYFLHMIVIRTNMKKYKNQAIKIV